MLILADHHQKLIYTRAHLLPPSSPSGNSDDQKSNPTFFSNMQKVHKKTDVCLGLTKLSLPTLAEVTWLSRRDADFTQDLVLHLSPLRSKDDASTFLHDWPNGILKVNFVQPWWKGFFFSTIQICFVRWCQNTVIGEKSSKGLRLITRQIYWLLLPFALGLDGHLTSSNKTKSHTHKKHYCPNTNHNQVNPYPNHSENYAALLDITNLAIWKIPLLIASHFSMFARTIGDWFSLDPWIIAWIPLLLWKTHCAPSEIGKCGIGYH